MLLERLSRPVRGVRMVRRGALEPGDSATVHIIPMRPLDQREVQRLLDRVDRHRERVVTSALSKHEREVFLGFGFVERESLHLLRHDLTGIEGDADDRSHEMSDLKLRPGRRTDLHQVLSIDRRSFDRFWALDRESLNAARKATPTHRYTIATSPNAKGKPRVVGYAVTGRSGPSAFFQRLGVDPDQRRRGIGSALVLDALRWAREGGATSMLVNTQDSNERALSLYQHLGFDLVEDQLKVLELPGAQIPVNP